MLRNLEEILITQFHKQISDSIKEVYDVKIPQFENVRIISVKKEFLPEPSEEIKPGKVYEIKLRVEVLNVKGEKSLEIALNNDSD